MNARRPYTFVHEAFATTATTRNRPWQRTWTYQRLNKIFSFSFASFSSMCKLKIRAIARQQHHHLHVLFIVFRTKFGRAKRKCETLTMNACWQMVQHRGRNILPSFSQEWRPWRIFECAVHWNKLSTSCVRAWFVRIYAYDNPVEKWRDPFIEHRDNRVVLVLWPMSPRHKSPTDASHTHRQSKKNTKTK